MYDDLVQQFEQSETAYLEALWRHNAAATSETRQVLSAAKSKLNNVKRAAHQVLFGKA